MKRLFALLAIGLISASAALADDPELENRSMWWSYNNVGNASYGDYTRHNGKVLVTWLSAMPAPARFYSRMWHLRMATWDAPASAT